MTPLAWLASYENPNNLPTYPAYAEFCRANGWEPIPEAAFVLLVDPVKVTPDAQSDARAQEQIQNYLRTADQPSYKKYNVWCITNRYAPADRHVFSAGLIKSRSKVLQGRVIAGNRRVSK